MSSSTHQLQQPPQLNTSFTTGGDSVNSVEQDSDVDMEESSPSDASPLTAVPQSSTSSYMSPGSLVSSPAIATSTTSPPMESTHSTNPQRNPSISQVSSAASDLPSPAFTARHFSRYSLSGSSSLNLSASATASGSRSLETSPTILPGDYADHDASATLLMLNRDRRGSKDSAKGRALSVKDLLSS